jgi:glutamine cyclotransferase
LSFFKDRQTITFAAICERFNIPITTPIAFFALAGRKTRPKINELLVKNVNLSLKGVRGFRNLLLALSCLWSCRDQPKEGSAIVPAPESVPVLNYSVSKAYPHDTTLYTEGLVFHNHRLFESSGSDANHPQTRSIVGVDDLQSGRIEKKVELDKRSYFGEGIVFFGNKLYQLTYRNHTGFIYDTGTYRRLDSFRFQNAEGWALTTDSNSLIMSDGTSNLTYLDPVSLKPTRVLGVTIGGAPLDSLNELEYIDKYIYANRFTQNYIVKIDPASGKVVGKLDLSSLVEQEQNRNRLCDVLNGIAYDPTANKIFVTGKLWAQIYEIAFSH